MIDNKEGEFIKAPVEKLAAVTEDFAQFAFMKGEVLTIKHSRFKITSIGKKFMTLRLLSNKKGEE